jgi:sporulation protein YlmC with PRC-barrel domain
MLFPSERLIDTPIMSLQTGSELARTKSALIDPRNLKIVAYELSGYRLEQQPTLLLTKDIREISSLGIIIDSSDEFIGVEDVVRINEIYSLQFSLINKIVRDEKNSKLGKVIDYSMEPNSFIIKQLIVRRPLLKSFSDTEIIVDRTQIVEVNDTTVIIKHDEREPAPAQQAVKSFANPFRGTSPQSEAINSNVKQS